MTKFEVNYCLAGHLITLFVTERGDKSLVFGEGVFEQLKLLFMCVSSGVFHSFLCSRGRVVAFFVYFKNCFLLKW
jgi:hypothetical protein